MAHLWRSECRDLLFMQTETVEKLFTKQLLHFITTCFMKSTCVCKVKLESTFLLCAFDR